MAALAAALVVAVPAAWAAFTDVPPSNPFYNDVNAIQGAGITSGCGGGNFCPNDNITRQAEAAFVHRNAPRTAFFDGLFHTISTTPGTATDLGSVTLDIGGVAGGTQFVEITASVDTVITSTTGCPCATAYEILHDDQAVSAAHFNTEDSVGSDLGDGAYGIDTGSVQAVVPVPTGTTQTFHVVAAPENGTGSVRGAAQITAVTGPFGSTGGSTLGAAQQHAAGAGPSMPQHFAHIDLLK